MCAVCCCSWICFFFFFSSRRRHTRSDRDWSSDVCSSDLAAFAQGAERVAQVLRGGVDGAHAPRLAAVVLHLREAPKDRKSVVEGKSVDLGGRRIIKKINAKGALTYTDIAGDPVLYGNLPP